MGWKENGKWGSVCTEGAIEHLNSNPKAIFLCASAYSFTSPVTEEPLNSLQMLNLCNSQFLKNYQYFPSQFVEWHIYILDFLSSQFNLLCSKNSKHMQYPWIEISEGFTIIGFLLGAIIFEQPLFSMIGWNSLMSSMSFRLS